MTRVKRGTTALKRRRSVLRQVKGYRLQRKAKERVANEAIAHAKTYAFRDRRVKKRMFRRLWTTRINAAVRAAGFQSYSAFMHALRKKDIALDRKTIATLATDHPEIFERVVKEASS